MAGRLSPGILLSLGGSSWLFGVACQLQQASLDEAGVYLCWMVSGCMVGALAVRRRHGLTLLFVALAAGLIAFGASGWHAQSLLADALPRDLEGDDLTLVGTVAAMPQPSEDGVRLRLAVDEAWRPGMPGTAPRRVAVPRLVALSWSRGLSDSAEPAAPPPAFGAGERWQLAVRLRRPHGNANPHGFDYELWAFEQGLRATGSIRTQPASTSRLAEARGYWIERARQSVRDAIMARVPDARAAGVLAALAVGDQGAIGRRDWDVFRQTGVAHVMSISGLHVAMFSWLAGGLVSIAWRRRARLALWWPTAWASRWCGVAAALAYALFSGWGVPAQRTACMLFVTAALQTSGVRWPWPLLLLSAAVVVTAWDPWALLQPGFWLSFMAVGLLMASGAARPADDAQGGLAAERPVSTAAWVEGTRSALVGRWGMLIGNAWGALKRSMREGLRGQLIATLGLAPLTLVIFQQISVVGFLANLVAIPAVTFVITPLALLGIGWPALWGVGAGAAGILFGLLERLAQVPGAVVNVPVVPWWAQCSALAGALVLLLPWHWRLRALGLPLVWPLAVPIASAPQEGQFELIAVDVGQGTAVLVRTRGHLLVYDTGPRYSAESDAGQRVLGPLLTARGERRIDLLVLSHRDTDHVGGAASLLGSMQVEAMLSSLPPEHPLRVDARLQGRPDDACRAGRRWTWDGVDFEVLHPFKVDDEAARSRANRVSCVLRVQSTATAPGGSSVSALLTGDIEAEQERALVAAAGPALESTVLIAPHHGSRTSSTSAFLDAVRSRFVVFQSGYLNRFGHPAPDVVARYAALGVHRESSPMCGAWTWRSAEASPRRSEVAGVCQRSVDHRYWQWTP